MAHPLMLAGTHRNLGEVYLFFESTKSCLQQMPNSVLLPASQQSAMEMILFRIDLGLAHCFTCNRAERRGGLNLFWQDEFAVQISSFSPLLDLGWVLLYCEQLCRDKPSHIEVVIVDPGGCQWLFTGFSGQPETDSPLLWLRLGALNATLSKSKNEKGILLFWLGSAWGDISKFWCGRSNFHVVKEDDGVLQGQYGPQAGKGALDPLLTYDSQGLLRIGTDGHMFGYTCRRIRYLATEQRRTTPLLLLIIF
ncbi:hypothetical protein SLEP1_g15393 [Rubroshorea leprosula]|uniref:Uncharacterized protein n=1 Tax=Rubroshorea leprosula TaxID=152421 RepID=A0AAV5IXQ1_9ROSI|nr:hypothetical protein SLEP1_g15393 [Rubroshorea leprosula]